MSVEQTRAINRSAMPNVARMIDEFRAANPDLEFKVVYARDDATGFEVGTPTDTSNSFVIPPNYNPGAEVVLERGKRQSKQPKEKRHE
jgi:hypothetical protein